MKGKKNIFIFGAGASIDEGLPPQEKLLKTYFETAKSDSLRKDLEHYFKAFFKINVDDLDNAKFPTFEEALGIVELAIEKEETYGPNYPLEELRKIRSFLILSMGIAIENCKLNDKNTYKRLIGRLFRGGHFLENEYGFINYNYDILLDKALMELVEKDIYVDYGIEFSNQKFFKQPFGKWESTIGKNNVKYLKPHGSFNWMCCPKCNSIYITGREAGREKGQFFRTGYLHDIEHCLKDQSELYCVVEPPSFFKKYKNIYLQNIWKKTYDLLTEADKIFFIGYSLPEADIWFKYLLKRSCFQKDKQFIVINPVEEQQLRPNYERLLGGVIYHQKEFFDFAKNHLEYMGT